MRPVNLFRSPAPIVLAACLALAACTSATPSIAPASAPPSEAPVTASPPSTPAPARPTPTPTPTSTVGNDQSPVDPRSYTEMPDVFEMTNDCGLCGPEGWLLGLRDFRLYADGLAVYRAKGDRATTAPFHFIRLGEDAMQDLLRYALDDINHHDIAKLFGRDPVRRG